MAALYVMFARFVWNTWLPFISSQRINCAKQNAWTHTRAEAEAAREEERVGMVFQLLLPKWRIKTIAHTTSGNHSFCGIIVGKILWSVFFCFAFNFLFFCLWCSWHQCSPMCYEYIVHIRFTHRHTGCVFCWIKRMFYSPVYQLVRKYTLWYV